MMEIILAPARLACSVLSFLRWEQFVVNEYIAMAGCQLSLLQISFPLRQTQLQLTPFSSASVHSGLFYDNPCKGRAPRILHTTLHSKVHTLTYHHR